jgi:hypothetical protein
MVNPIEQANKIMNGCGKIVEVIRKIGETGKIDTETNCGNILFINEINYGLILCEKCQTSRQTAIDIFEEELKFLEDWKKRLTAKDNKEMIEEFSKDKEFWKGVKISFDLFVNNLDSRITKLNKALEILK